MNFHFEKLTTAHKETVLSWFATDHVREFFYGQGLQNTLNNIDKYCDGLPCYFDQWIGFIDDQPFSFLITCEIQGPVDPSHAYKQWYQDGKRTFTLDVLIGPGAFLGKGLAVPMIQSFIKQQLQHADVIMIDPEAGNQRAIHVYKKVGFSKVGEIIPEFNPKPHVMMKLVARASQRAADR